ncbi:hypothetical protein BJX70DRAFT_396081 [Aspergillus crustosus]
MSFNTFLNTAINITAHAAGVSTAPRDHFADAERFSIYTNIHATSNIPKGWVSINSPTHIPPGHYLHGDRFSPGVLDYLPARHSQKKLQRWVCDAAGGARKRYEMVMGSRWEVDYWCVPRVMDIDDEAIRRWTIEYNGVSFDGDGEDGIQSPASDEDPDSGYGSEEDDEMVQVAKDVPEQHCEEEDEEDEEWYMGYDEEAEIAAEEESFKEGLDTAFGRPMNLGELSRWKDCLVMGIGITSATLKL